MSLAKRAQISPIKCYTDGYEFIKSDYWNLWVICFVGGLIAGFFPLLLMGPISCGIALCFFARKRGHKYDFNLLFKGFDYFVPGLLVMLMNFGLAMLLILPFIAMYLAGFGMLFAASANESVGFGFAGFGLILLAALGGAFVNVLLNSLSFFACALIVDQKLEPFDAFKTAVSGITKNAFGLIGHALFGAIIGLVLTLVCFILVFLLIPIYQASLYVAYVKIFGTNESFIAGQPPSKPAKNF